MPSTDTEGITILPAKRQALDGDIDSDDQVQKRQVSQNIKKTRSTITINETSN